MWIRWVETWKILISTAKYTFLAPRILNSPGPTNSFTIKKNVGRSTEAYRNVHSRPS